MSLQEPPPKPYTVFQKREVIRRIAAKEGCTLDEASDRFFYIETTEPEQLKAIVAKIPEQPKKSAPDFDKVEREFEEEQERKKQESTEDGDEDE